jgi:hypothetical protein
MTRLADTSCCMAVPLEHPACESRIPLHGKRPLQKCRIPQGHGRACPRDPMRLQAFPDLLMAQPPYALLASDEWQSTDGEPTAQSGRR